ncbi:MAG: choice-of-anchor D domain-containing protein [Terriglobales bacterium]
MSKPVACSLAVLLLLPAFMLAQTSSRSSAVQSGIWRGRPINYSLVNGKAIYQGDIILDHVAPIMSHAAVSASGMGHARGESMTIAYSQYLWPKVGGVATVYYIIDANSDPQATPTINAAIAQFNLDFPGLIQWVQWNPQNPQSPNYVDIDLSGNDYSGSCEASEGYEAVPAQPMTGSFLCAEGTILHEMGHVIGLWHEQSRSDRDTYVTVNYQNIIKGSRFNFDIIQDDVQNMTLYDYASLMQYPAFSFIRNGGPGIETIPAGMPLGSFDGIPVPQTVDYSAGDKEGIERLYGTPPTQITVTSNPPGLQVTVDGVAVTTPQVYTWALNSTHTLAVPTNVQTLTGFIQGSTTTATFYYTYGRWNDSTAQNHSITVTPGNGDVPFPATSPQVATYTANFIQLVPYTTNVYPANTGSVVPSPQPQSYPGVSGVYFIARQQATMTATAISGWNFYDFNNGPFWLPAGLSANPKTFYVPDSGDPVNTTVYFSNTPVYTVDLTPETFSSNEYAYIDGGFWYTPKNFSSFYDSTWSVGSQHTLNIDSLEYPFSINSRFAFDSWSDGGAQSHTITLPAGSTSYIATVTPEFAPADNWQFGLPCGAASATITPGSPSGDGFYPTGQVLTFDQTPATGWTFAGWSYDLTGLTSPQNLTVTDEVLVFANYNTTDTPISMISLSPPSAAAGAANFTLTITGTGFTSGTQVWVNNTFRSSTFVNSTTLQVTVTAADIASPTAFQIFVQNFPSGSVCSVSAAMPFLVYQPGVAITAAPASLTFASQAVATTSTAKSVMLTNTGSATASVSISGSGNFAEANTCNGSLGAGASCTVNVTFSPTDVGAISGAVTVTDTASNSPQVISLSGTGATPLTLSPATMAFGNVAVGTTSAAKTATVTNNQATTLNFTFAASGNYAAVGSGTSPCGTSLAAGKSCTMSVTFAPTANGNINGAVTVTDSTLVKQQEVTLSGTGTGGSAAPLKFAPASLTFASQAFNSASPAQTVTVTNSSASSVTLSAIAGSGNYTAAGSGTTPCKGGTVLAKNGACTMSVTFTPTYLGTIKGAITVSDNASVNQQILNVSGSAVLPVTFSPVSLTFAAQNVGTTSAPQTVMLTNNLSTTLSKIAVSASGDFALASNGCAATLAAAGQCTFSVTFTPSQTGSIKGAVTVTDSAIGSPQVVNLAGTGQ